MLEPKTEIETAARTPRFSRSFSEASRIARAYGAEVFGGRDKTGPLYSIRRLGNQFLTLAGTFCPHADLLVIKTEEIV